jgi:hypothetical protein
MSQRRMMFLVVAVVLMGPALVQAQDVVAEVETWRGRSLRIVQPSLDVLYTVVPAPLLAPTGGTIAGTPGTAAQAAAPVSASGGRTVRESVAGSGPQPIQSRRPQSVVTFVRDGVELQVPFERIATMVIERRTVLSHKLPAYADQIVQSLATATLVDGSTIEAAQVNFGSARLRGIVPQQGTIELLLEDVKTFKITR